MREKKKKIPVRFVKGYRSYNLGEIAGFGPELAANLIKGGVAVAVKASDEKPMTQRERKEAAADALADAKATAEAEAEVDQESAAERKAAKAKAVAAKKKAAAAKKKTGTRSAR